MYTDLLGRKRMKVNLHMHTTLSDGRVTPERAAEIYRAAGYDLIAVTDHWKWRAGTPLAGLRTLSGAEYNIGGNDGARGVYHILGLGCREAPALAPDAEPQRILDEVNRLGGLAVLAHPAWSLNTWTQAATLHGVGATEIYNTVSDVHESSRPYSGDFVDTAAGQGLFYPLLATDDAHHYDGTDETRSWIMLDCDEHASDEQVLQAIRAGRFYATQGPEIHLTVEDGAAVVHCTPASRIAFFSNNVWGRGHGHRGEGMTEARCPLQPFETFVRAEVTDEKGDKAWSNMIVLRS
ncbi:MAG: CehA/McbA family metallohydrolase [Clostridiales bacterium]|nr:CehA/McbA family metallohydrolase [Clostridiales bacterium]